MTERLSQFLDHLKQPGGSVRGRLLEKHADDIVVTCALRTPLCRAGKGGLANTPLDMLIYELLVQVRERSHVPAERVDTVTVGNVLNGKAAYMARAAALAAGFPNTTPVQIINRFCSSGLMAIQSVANEIKAGEIEIGVAMGAESMSFDADPAPPEFSDVVAGASQEARDCAEPMGWTSENVSRDFDVTREQMDAYAARSFNRAEAAQASGATADEIVAIHTGEGGTVSQDDGIRKGTTPAALSKVRPAFPQWGACTTGGNASQITDGAAAVVLMKRATAEALKLPIMGKYVTTSVAGLAPRIMGIGPTVAIPKLLQRLGMSVDDVDIFEINEAFASMAVYCERVLHIPADKLNPRGGAIALGHPLGATGARVAVTLLSELKEQGKQIGITSMCVGTGQAAAALWVRE